LIGKEEDEDPKDDFTIVTHKNREFKFCLEAIINVHPNNDAE